MDTQALGAEALEKLKGTFSAQRWGKIERQAAHHCGLDAGGLQALCVELLATSHARHPRNDAAALYGAANRLLLAVGSVLKDEDVTRFEASLKAAPAVDAPKPKRGGKADPVPPPAS